MGIFVGVFLLIDWQGSARGGEVTDQVKQTVDKVIAILKDPSLQGPEQKEKRRMAIRNAVGERFDFTEMAKRSLARHWAKRSAAEQKEFVQTFSALVENSYASNIEGYTDEKVVYTGESLDGNYAEVKTKIVTAKNEIPIDYRLLKVNAEWMVYDVVIEGVSLVNNYRTQFNKIIGQSSYEDLVQKMKAKLAEDASTKTL
jgi:phospholipid transport system substrate-binding protein